MDFQSYAVNITTPNNTTTQIDKNHLISLSAKHSYMSADSLNMNEIVVIDDALIPSS